jgi:hypothetical protein
VITYDRLCRKPAAFPALTGVTREEFDRLFDDFAAAHHTRRAAATHTKRAPRPLRRAAGAGHPFALDDRTRLAVALVWLRVYPTYELLGWLFGLDKSNAWHNVRDVLATLEALATFPFERPAADRRKLDTVGAVMDAFPQVRLVIDGKEQGCRRPTSWDDQKPFYSGKRKRHTAKTQVACRPDGRIGAVSDSVPGSTHDLTLLRQTGLLDRLDPAAGAGAMLDKGYVGAQGDRPALPLVLPAKAARGRPLTDGQKAANQVVSRYRVVVEHVMAQLNRFQVLKQVFRSLFDRHTQAVRVVATLVDRRIAVTPLKAYAAAT